MLPPDSRELHYCNDCRATSAFVVRRDERGQKYLVCCGDERGPKPRPGCGKILHDSEVKRFYGDCMFCRRVQRAAWIGGEYLCLICGSPIENVEERHHDRC